MILVIANSCTHYGHWCREVGLPNNNDIVRYIVETDQLNGMIGRHDVDILLLPEWYKGKSTSDVEKFNYLVQEHWNRRLYDRQRKNLP